MAVDFNAWLQSSDSAKCILVEVDVKSGGSEITRYLSSRHYIEPSGTIRNFKPLINAESVQVVERLSLDGNSSMNFGDVEIINKDGALDSWLDDVWSNRRIVVKVGDVRWEYSDFVVIFDGVVEDIDSRNADTLNLKMRDKLQRLNNAVSELTLGGTTPNKEELVPLTFGEVFNITPLLTDPATLEYQVHNGLIEDIIEVRDNGVPVGFTKFLSTGKFRLTATPFGKVTASVQGFVKAQNLITWSEQFNQAAWFKNSVTVTANSTVSPDGNTTADKIESTGADGNTGISINVKPNTAFTFSVWLRADIPLTFRIYIGTSNGTAGSAFTVVNVTTEWKRYQVSFTMPATTTLGYSQIGGGGSFTTGEIVYAWGAQAEESGIAMSYVKTEGTVQNIFLKTAAGILRYLLINYGSPNTRFASTDMDLENIQTFEEQNPQALGVYLKNRENMITLCEDILKSVGGQLVMSRTGKLQLLKIDLPPAGTPFEIDQDDIIQNSLRISEKHSVEAAHKLGYCKNWTVQQDLQTGIPANHKNMFAQEWLTKVVQDATVKTEYKLTSEPEMVETYLLTEADTNAEANRVLNLFKVPRYTIEFTGTGKLVQLVLGQAIKVTYPRFGLNNGKTGIVVGLSIDWETLLVKAEVLV